MLTQSATFTIGTDGFTRDITVTPLFFQNHSEPWQPNEIYELAQCEGMHDSIAQKFNEPLNLGKIIIDEHKEWHYEGAFGLAEEDIEKIAQFVMAKEAGE